MNVRYIKFAAIGVCWTLFYLFAARIFAGMLCSTVRTYKDAAGIDVHQTTLAADEVVWDLMLSPLFAIPAIVAFLGGWLLIWRKSAGRSHRLRPSRIG